MPGFLQNPRGQINRTSFLPEVNGRDFDSLQSEGLSVEVNVAHALAHHATAEHFGLPLPGLLLIDGLSGAFGTTGYDPKRVEALYSQLARAAERFSGTLQIIVSDVAIPTSMEGFVRLELTETDRLIPEADLQRLSAEAAGSATESHSSSAEP